jgi:hypothetical protein
MYTRAHPGPKAIKTHAFFSPLSWEDLMAKRLQPPWWPKFVNVLDTSNFDSEFTQLDAVDSVASPTRLTMSVQAKFDGFSFVGKSDMHDRSD